MFNPNRSKYDKLVDAVEGFAGPLIRLTEGELMATGPRMSVSEEFKTSHPIFEQEVEFVLSNTLGKGGSIVLKDEVQADLVTHREPEQGTLLAAIEAFAAEHGGYWTVYQKGADRAGVYGAIGTFRTNGEDGSMGRLARKQGASHDEARRESEV